MTDCPYTPGLMMRPAARIVRELPPSSWLSDDGCCGCDPHRASGLRSRSVLCAQGTPEVSTDRLHTCQPSSLNHGCIPCRGFLPSGPTCGPCCRAEYGRWKSTDEKKPLEKTPGEKPIALWATSAPNGAGVLSNGYHFVGISPPTTSLYHHISTNVNTQQKIFCMLLDVVGRCWKLIRG